MHTKRKSTRKGTTYLYSSTKGKPPSTPVVRGPDPDTHRSRDGPGHDLQCSRDGPGHRLFAVRGTPRRRSSLRDRPGFFCSRAGPGHRLLRRTDPHAGFLTGRTCEDETSTIVQCSTSWPQARHPRSLAGLPPAWKRELPGKGLPTSARACSILSRTGSGGVQGRLPQASGNGHGGCDSGAVLAGSERIAQLPGNEPPRGS